MKKITIIIITCLITLSSVLGQSSFSSISVSDTDSRYSLKAHFSHDLSHEVEEEINDVLGEPIKKSGILIWEEEAFNEKVYSFKLRDKSCRIYLSKESLSEKKFEELSDLCLKIEQILNKDTPERPTPPKRPFSSSNFQISIDNSSLSLDNTSSLQGEMSVTTDQRSVNVTNNNKVYSIQSNGLETLPSKVQALIINELGASNSVKANGHKEWRKEIKGKAAYTISISEYNCNVFIDKKVLSKKKYPEIYTLANDIIKLLL